MAFDVAPAMGMEGEVMEPELPPLMAEGEMGAHVVVINGEMISETELLAQLFELAASLPNMIQEAKMPQGRVFVHISPEQVKLVDDIHVMLKELENPTDNKAANAKPQELAKKPEVHRSLFSLASAMNSASSKPRSTSSAKRASQPAVQTSAPLSAPISTQARAVNASKNAEKTENNLRVEEREGGGQKRDQQQDDSQKKKKPQISINKVCKKNANVTTTAPDDAPPVNMGSIENIYVKFMALMARILGQAEAEAHALYIKIKDRTDKIDVLSALMGKINSADKSIDWSEDPQMRELVDKAREIGVDIPEGKYKWEETEKHLLKENIQMRKDGMEKITQLERTDMQRYLQEASQCHQARSNVLKLLKEVIDTIIHNMRP